MVQVRILLHFCSKVSTTPLFRYLFSLPYCTCWLLVVVHDVASFPSGGHKRHLRSGHKSIYLTCNNVHIYIYIYICVYFYINILKYIQYNYSTCIWFHQYRVIISFRGPLSIPYLELKLAPVFTEKGLLLRGTNPKLKMKCIPVVWYTWIYIYIHAISSQQIFIHPGRVLEFLAEAEAERARLWYQMSVTWL